ncbi:MAG TPA: hypothetical protein VGZ47_18725, partial [Gemmataceae bacterium]|nr:hypothetical protein [Gemmataceae bacterium]
SSGGVFHYGDHSNHVTLLLARHNGPPAVLSGSQVIWPTKGEKKPPAATFPLSKDALAVALAVDGDYAVVGTAVSDPVNNLFLLKKGEAAPVWMRSVNTETAEAPKPEKGLYGTPTLPDGTREELPQRDEKIWAPLSVALHVGSDGKRRIAVADYQGWQRWVRSSATMKHESLGVRFMPARPAITIYDEKGEVVRRFAPEQFSWWFWSDLRFLPDGKRLIAWPHNWTCRGLAGQTILPADGNRYNSHVLDTGTGKAFELHFGSDVADIAVKPSDSVVATCWDGRFAILTDQNLAAANSDVPGGYVPFRKPSINQASLVRISPNGSRMVVAGTNGVVDMLDDKGKELWQTNLNTAVKRTPKPWVANARATPIAKGVWQLPGGRVESDLGGQRLIEAPDGLILTKAMPG